MKILTTLLLATVTAGAVAIDPSALYPFEATSTGSTPESMSSGAITAALGPAGSIAGNSRRLGTASLRVNGTKASAALPEGDDGAVSSNNLVWSTDTRTIAFWMRALPTQTDPLATMVSLGSSTTSGARFDIRLQTGGATSASPPGATGLLRLEIQGGFVECTAADCTNAGLSFTNLRDGTWHHLAVVVPAATSTVHQVLFYIDGVPVSHSTQGTNQAINTATGPLRIGDSYQDGGRDFNGYLDDVRVFDLALTAQEVLDLYNDGVTNASAIAAFDAAPEVLADGGTTQLSWQVDGATAIAIDQGVGDVTGESQIDTTVNGEGTVTYTLSVTTAGGPETAALDLTVLGPLRISASQLTAAGFSFTVHNLVPETQYQAEYSFSLQADGWVPLGAAFAGPATTTATLIDSVANPAVDPKIFYRVKEVVSP